MTPGAACSQEVEDPVDHLTHVCLDPRTADSVAWYAVVAPGLSAHVETMIRLAEIAVKGAPDANTKVSSLGTLGASLYRAGRFEDAIRRLEESNQIKNVSSNLEDLAFLAMAHHRLGHHDEARRYLDRLRGRQPSAKADEFWHDQFWYEIQIRLLQNEAEAMILYDPVFPADPFAH